MELTNSCSLFVIEEEGKFGAQIYTDEEALRKSFDNFSRSPSGRVNARVSKINLSWDGDGKLSVCGESKIVPPVVPVDLDGPDGMSIDGEPYFIPEDFGKDEKEDTEEGV